MKLLRQANSTNSKRKMGFYAQNHGKSIFFNNLLLSRDHFSFKL